MNCLLLSTPTSSCSLWRSCCSSHPRSPNNLEAKKNMVCCNCSALSLPKVFISHNVASSSRVIGSACLTLHPSPLLNNVYFCASNTCLNSTKVMFFSSRKLLSCTAIIYTQLDKEISADIQRRPAFVPLLYIFEASNSY